MMKLKLLAVILFTNLLGASAQSKTQPYNSFLKYLTTHFKFPESVRENCEWYYLMIKVNVNSANKIVGYACLNQVDASEKKGLDVLLNYTFPKSDHLNNHPLIVMLSLDKSEICDYNLSYKVYSPADAINVYAGYIAEELKKDSKINIIWGTAEIKYGATQH